MHSERQLSQSLPDHVILSDIEADDDDDDDDGGHIDPCQINELDDPSKTPLKHDSYIRRYNDRFNQYDRFQGFRSSYKRAIEHDTSPYDSPTMGRSEIQYYRKSKTKDATIKSDPVLTKKAQSDDAIIMDYSKWTLNDSDRDYNEDIFPVQIERRLSGQHIRNRRNPHFHGNRAIRPRRVVGKTGEWNIGVLNIPERSLRFFRDIVTTLRFSPEPDQFNNFPVTYERRQSVELLKRRRLSFRRKVVATRRAVKKTGDINIRVHNITRSVKYLKDFVTTLIDEQWRYTLTIFTLSYFVIWLVFGVLFYWVGYRHGDLDIDKLTGQKVDNSTLPCIMKCQTFIGFLLLSIETQTTIGFGSKYPSEECPETITLIVIQMIVSTAIEGAMIGILYTKMIRPPKRTRDYTFSRKAVVCMRDSKLCLVFRVDDPKRNHTIETRVEAFWLGPKMTEEGEQLSNYQYSLKLENNGRVSLLWPQTIAHVIDEDSPLYDYSAKDCLDKKFEVIVSISGSSNSTGQVTQALASYLSREIMWGHRFVNIISYDSEKQIYLADYNRFDSTEMIPTALCSACRLDEVIDEFKFQPYKENSYDSENLDL